MISRHSIMICVCGAQLFRALAVAGAGELQLRSDIAPKACFGGGWRYVSIRLQSTASDPRPFLVEAKLYQSAARTVMSLGGTEWGTITLIPRQDTIATHPVLFPAVNAETRFLIQWLADGSNVIGQTEVLVYPTNLLVQLKALAGDEPLGVFDPTAELSPLLRMQAVPFQDLQEDGTDKFRGKLAIVGPFETKAQMRASLRDDIRALAKRGVAVVWLQPPATELDPFKPSFYVVREHPGAVVVASHELTAGLAERPQAQLNLLRLAEAAMHPMPLNLPESETSN